MAYGTVNADTITTSSGAILGAGNASAMKNRIINGAMVIDQRNAGASITPVNGSYTLDRWYFFSAANLARGLLRAASSKRETCLRLPGVPFVRPSFIFIFVVYFICLGALN